MSQELQEELAADEAVLGAREDQMLIRVEWDALTDAVRQANGRTTYYVATLAQYVLVDAASEVEARSLGQVALRDFPTSSDAPVNIRIVRPATSDETELQRFFDEGVAHEATLHD